MRPGFQLGLVLLLGSAGILSTYNVLSQTSDEPIHIAAGLEWLEDGRYTFEELHPPMARVAAALGLYVTGSRLDGSHLRSDRSTHQIGTDLLHGGAPPTVASRSDYFRRLSLARLGILPFFLITVVAVWFWARRLYDLRAAFFAALLVATQPMILAHAGVATTDMAGTCMLVCSLLAFSVWLERPTFPSSVILGAAWGLAILTKFSNLVFLPAGMFPVLVVYAVTRQSRFRAWLRGSLVWGVTGVLLVWGGYLFSVQPLVPVSAHSEVDKLVGSGGTPHDVAHQVLAAPVWPLKELAYGVSDVAGKNRHGHTTYFLGEKRESGVWYYFPVVLALKTPIPFFLLVMVGLVVPNPGARRRMLVPGVGITAIMAIAMAGDINIGVRHVLAVYPLLAIIGGIGAAALWSRVQWGAATVVLLLASQALSAGLANPDYLVYANLLATGRTEWFLSGSDLDWGQDLDRLRAELTSRGVSRIHLAYFGSADVMRHGLGEVEVLEPGQRVSGWVAVSVRMFQDEPGFRWLTAYEPVALVGRTIRLYQIP